MSYHPKRGSPIATSTSAPRSSPSSSPPSLSIRRAPVSWTKQRVALPQLSTSPPSLFQIRILRSADWLGSSTISWSQPMPVRRSASARARRRDVERRFARIDDHEIVAEPMHLVEVAAHWARDLGSAPGQVHLARIAMPRAANDVMQSIVFSAVLDAIAALKRASGGLPNQLLRDVQAIHPNVTFADLPKALQDQIAESTRAAFTQLLKEGYAVGPRQQMQTTRPIDRVPEHQRHGRGTPDRRGPPRG